MLLTDVTLREGDQMPGREFSAEEKIEGGHALDSLGVPFVQPGFPATGTKDQRVVSALAETTDAEVVALARALEEDVDVAIDAGADVVETFVSVSDSHLEHLFDASREGMHAMLAHAVSHVRERGGTPHVTLADAFRTPPEQLIDALEAVPEVPYVTLADSVGARTPASVEAHLNELAGRVDLSRLGVHFHDDLGCATANALAAYRVGVGKADVSVGGLGERAGNSALEEVVVACTLDNDDDLGIATGELVPTCRGLLETLGEAYDDRKAVIGPATVEHESGIHTAAMLSDPATLEPYDPARFGAERRLVFGPQTGKGAARKLLQRVAVEADDGTVSAYLELLAEEGPMEMEAALGLAEREFGT